MKRLENLSKQEFEKVSEIIREAFLENNMFYEFGDGKTRKALVFKYMNLRTKAAYKMGSLYSNSQRTAFIAIIKNSKKLRAAEFFIKIKMFFSRPFQKVRRFFKHLEEIKNNEYLMEPHLKIMFLCVKKSEQGKGKMKELINFAKELSKNNNTFCVVNTDSEEYKNKYEHYGFTVYNEVSAKNGIKRYNLIYNK